MSLPIPAIFVGHGSPMNAIEDTVYTQEWKRHSKELHQVQVPRAILCISAHWITDGTKITVADPPKTIHDFGGFPQELYQIQYPAVGSPTLAGEISALISSRTHQKFKIKYDTEWGLDHGTWSVFLHLYPKAEIPVLQLSLDANASFEEHWEWGEALRALIDEDILVIGSGNLVHNLSLYNWKNPDDIVDWAVEADDIFVHWFTNKKKEDIVRVENYNRSLKLAASSLEHLIPAFYIGGFRKNEKIEFFNKAVQSSLSMTSFLLRS